MRRIVRSVAWVMGLAMAGLLTGCSSTPEPDKMAAALVAVMPTMSMAQMKDGAVNLTDVQIKALEPTGVSAAAFTAGAEKMKTDKEYAKAVGTAMMSKLGDQMKNLVPKTGQPGSGQPGTGQPGGSPAAPGK